MRVSTKGRYGLRAMVFIALNMGNNPVSISKIAETENISESYLEQVFSTLKKSGLVRSVRGSGGGYELALPPEKITAGMILRILEGPVSPVFCVENSDSTSNHQECINEENCPTYPFWYGLNECINSYIDSITLKQLSLKNFRKV